MPVRALSLPFRVLSLVLALAIAAGFGMGIGRSTPASGAADLGLPLFGVYLNGHSTSLADQTAQANAGWASVRVEWSILEPTENGGQLTNTAQLDALFAALTAKGITPVGVVGGAPTWAASGLHGPLIEGKEEAYYRFLESLVRRYSASPYNVHHWFVWPEADAIRADKMPAVLATLWADRGAWGDDGARLATVLKTAAPRAKAIDPNAKLILGPLAHDWFFDPGPTHPTCGGASPGFHCGGIFKYRFLDDFLAAGGGTAVDGVGLNAYISFAGGWETDAKNNGRSGVDLAAKVGHVRSRLSSHGLDLPIVIGEAGFWSAGVGVGVTDGQGTSLGQMTATAEGQAAYVGKVFARARDAGAVAVAWFTLDETSAVEKYALIDAAGTPKLAYSAYRFAATVLGGQSPRPVRPGEFVSTVSGPVESYGMVSGVRYAAVAWAKPTSSNYLNPTAQVAVGGGLRAYDSTGNELASVGIDSSGRALYNLTSTPTFFQRSTNSTVLVPISLRASTN